MSDSNELDALYEIADRFRRGTCPERIGERWCVHDEGHVSYYHVTDNGVAWIAHDGRVYDVHAVKG